MLRSFASFTIQEAAPPGPWGDWARRMELSNPDKDKGVWYGVAWKNHKAGKAPPKARHKRYKGDEIGATVKGPAKSTVQKARRKAKKKKADLIGPKIDRKEKRGRKLMAQDEKEFTVGRAPPLYDYVVGKR